MDAIKKQQTAVEWLIEQLTPSISLQQKHIDELKEKAKEMEKNQLKSVYSPIVLQNEDGNFYIKNFELYYKETYK